MPKLTKYQKQERGMILQKIWISFCRSYGEEIATQKVTELLESDDGYKKINALVAGLKLGNKKVNIKELRDKFKNTGEQDVAICD